MPRNGRHGADAGGVGGRERPRREPAWGEHHLLAHALVTAVLLAATVALAISMLTGTPLAEKNHIVTWHPPMPAQRNAAAPTRN
jgi:hypothetical protein